MSDEPGRKRTFTVRLVRPAFQSMDIRVRAVSDTAAIAAAVRKAVEANDASWEPCGLEEVSGAIDVVRVVDHTQAAADEREYREPGEARMPMSEVVADELDNALWARRYLLLSADIEEAEGAVVRPRWLQQLGEGLELADIAGDWLAEIEDLRDLGVRGFMHEMDEVARNAGHPGLYGDDPDAEPPADETDE